MKAMKRYYDGMGWSGYPHLFIAPDGIWEMNDLDKIGIHSNKANTYTYGIEVVGRYDMWFWQDPVKSFALHTIAELLTWSKLSIHDLYPHHQFNSTKSCPGNAVTMDKVKALVYDILLCPKLPTMKAYKTVVDVARIRQGPSLNYAIAGKLYVNDIFYSSAIKEDEVNKKYTWAHITQCTNRDGILNNIGFVRTDLAEEII